MALTPIRGGTTGKCAACRHFDRAEFVAYMNSDDPEAAAYYRQLTRQVGADAMTEMGLCRAGTRARGERMFTHVSVGCNSSVGIWYEPRTEDLDPDLLGLQVDAPSPTSQLRDQSAVELGKTEKELRELERLLAGGPEISDELRDSVEQLCRKAEKLARNVGGYANFELVRNVRGLLAQRRVKPEPRGVADQIRKELAEQERAKVEEDQRTASEAVEDLTKVGKRVIG